MSERATPGFLRTFLRTAVNLGGDVEGATAVEYGLITAFITVALVGVLPEVASTVILLPFSALISALASVLS